MTRATLLRQGVSDPAPLNHCYHLPVDRDLERGDVALCGHRFDPPRHPPTVDCAECFPQDEAHDD